MDQKEQELLNLQTTIDELNKRKEQLENEINAGKYAKYLDLKGKYIEYSEITNTYLLPSLNTNTLTSLLVRDIKIIGGLCSVKGIGVINYKKGDKYSFGNIELNIFGNKLDNLKEIGSEEFRYRVKDALEKSENIFNCLL